jgi:hypothetical protein
MSIGLLIRYPKRDLLSDRYYILPRSILTSLQREILQKLDNTSIEIMIKHRYFGKNTTDIKAYATTGFRRDCPIHLKPEQEKFLYELLVKERWFVYQYPDIAPRDDELPLRLEQYTWYCYA